jgi:hypothetical protein
MTQPHRIWLKLHLDLVSVLQAKESIAMGNGILSGKTVRYARGNIFEKTHNPFMRYQVLTVMSMKMSVF